jgi:hypothetical protein
MLLKTPVMELSAPDTELAFPKLVKELLTVLVKLVAEFKAVVIFPKSIL